MLDVRYARSGDADIAYAVFGEGEIPLVWTQGAYTHLEAQWAFPPYRRFCEALGEFTRLIIFDKQGMGMSSRVAGATPLEVRMDDIRAVMDAAAIERAALLGESEGGPLSMLFAAAHPERVSHLILQGAEVREKTDDDWPWGENTEEAFESGWDDLHTRWGRPEGTANALFGDGIGDTDWINEHMGRVQRSAVAPRDWESFARMAFEIDVRDVAPHVNVPTLVLHCAGDRICHVENGRFLGRTIPGARYIERSGTDHVPWLDPHAVVGDVREFLVGERTQRSVDRVLATLLFTDLVGSTDMAARLGDEAWRSVLESHYAMSRNEIERHHGTEVSTAGDGFLVRFDGPGRAIRCAEAIIGGSRRQGLEIRAGVHTGEVELIGRDVAGIGVHIGARVGGMAGPGEILVSSTVRDISAGSGVTFADRGRHELKGVPGDWQVYAVER